MTKITYLSIYHHSISCQSWHLIHFQSITKLDIDNNHRIVELGCIDIATKVSLLSSHLAQPCVLHTMAYLGLNQNSCLCMDLKYHDIENDQILLLD
ncbi:hypothetical protein ACHAXS_013120 [Conticribra weissflogii]